MEERIATFIDAIQQEYDCPKDDSGCTETCLPEEVEEGNTEYKLQLLNPAPERLVQLTTQLHWRLNEGKGVAFYELGVRDNGQAVGITQDDMATSIATLSKMCEMVEAELSLIRFRRGKSEHLRSARLQIHRFDGQRQTFKQLRISVTGDVASGKSTLVSVLTHGLLDDGEGLARMQVFRHRHELENGRTSCLSEHTIGVTADGQFHSLDAFDTDDFCEEDAPKDFTRLITLSDLAGHKKYLKVTAAGLAGQFPDYAFLVIDCCSGVQAMTKEHLKIAAALEVPLIIVLTKTDLVSTDRREETIADIMSLLHIVCPDKIILTGEHAKQSIQCIPIFQLSNVTGDGLIRLQQFLSTLEPTRLWAHHTSTPAEFHIGKAFELEDTGTIVTGLMQSGTIWSEETLLLGPDSSGRFINVVVDSIHAQHRPVQYLTAGEAGALLIRFSNPGMQASFVRRGMLLLHPSVRPTASMQFEAEVRFFDDSKRIRKNHQAVVHVGPVRQMARLVQIDGEVPQLRTALCRFEFMYYPEYLRPDLPLVLRDTYAQAVGKVIRTVPTSTSSTTKVK